MARYSGIVGYGVAVEDPPESGKWVDQITERSYRGDVVRNSMRLVPGENLNPDIIEDPSISIMGDTYAMAYYQRIKYVMWNGVRWTVTSVQVQRPRLILQLGEVYNGPTP